LLNELTFRNYTGYAVDNAKKKHNNYSAAFVKILSSIKMSVIIDLHIKPNQTSINLLLDFFFHFIIWSLGALNEIYFLIILKLYFNDPWIDFYKTMATVLVC
jgi:hypothetical protein